jgi:hypothetical protein
MSNYKNLIKSIKVETKSTRSKISDTYLELVELFPLGTIESENGLTNGRTEGFNRVAKLIQRNAYGFRNFENYRRRLIYRTM